MPRHVVQMEVRGDPACVWCEMNAQSVAARAFLHFCGARTVCGAHHLGAICARARRVLTTRCAPRAGGKLGPASTQHRKMGCCSSRSPGQHEWQANVPGSYKQNPIPQVNRKQEVPADFFQKCFMKGYLRTLPKRQRIWCMIHENNVFAPLPHQLPCIALAARKFAAKA